MASGSPLRHFCVGAEIQSFGTTTIIHTDKEKFVRLTDALQNVSVPTVAALNGGVLGGGLEIALLRHDSCRRYGFPRPGGGRGRAAPVAGWHPAPSAAGRIARAKEISMIGRRHTPEAFERWGIINLVVPEEELATSSMTWARLSSRN